MNPSTIFKNLLRIPAALLIIFLFAMNTSAQDLNALVEEDTEKEFPKVMSYEGFITDIKGDPLADGQYNFKFSLYDSPTGGAAIWTEEHKSVSVNNGYVQLMLGKGTSPNPLNVPFDKQYYLGIQFGDNTEMAPRLALTPSGYSFRARIADDVADGSITTDKLAYQAVTNDKIESINWEKINGVPVTMTSSGSFTDGWSLTGNIKTQPPYHFIGTTDENDLVFKTNNEERLKITKTGKVVVVDDVYMDDDNMICVKEDQERIIFDEDANDIEIMGADVGIGAGTESPEAKLHVKGIGENEKQHIVLFENSDNETGFAITKDQDVGIGTEVPEAKLHVKSTTGTFGGGGEDNHIALFENTQEGGDGIAVKLGPFNPNPGEPDPFGQLANSYDPHADNNFITFYSQQNEIMGRIEGQTYSEWTQSWEFIWETVMFAWDVILTIGEGIATASQLDWGEFAVLIGDFVGVIANYLEWVIYNGMNTGTYFSSGSGDYAECLARMYLDEKMESGDIVGVYGGKISKSTEGAHQIMVISTAPIILGNRPPVEQEHLYEKVAFLGQVLVKVRGPVNEGDYIILSGLDDGTGIAVSPELMTTAEFTKIVGKAWGSADGRGLNFVNVLVGLHSGDLAKFVNKQMRELRSTRTEMNVLKNEFLQMQEVMRHVITDQQLREKDTIKTSQR